MRLNSELIRNMDSDERQEFTGEWQRSRNVREKVAEVLTKRIESAIIESESKDILDSPNALGKLSDLNGYRRALREVKSILDQGNIRQ